MRDDRVLARTQLVIAVVRLSFAATAGVVIAWLLTDGTHNQDVYDVPDTEWSFQLWLVLALGLAVCAIVVVGAVGDIARVRRRRLRH